MEAKACRFCGRNLLSSSTKNKVVAGVVCLGILAVGVLAFLEQQRYAKMERTVGIEATMHGLRPIIADAMKEPDYPAKGSLYDLLGLPGFLTPWRKEEFITRVALAYSELPGAFSAKDLAQFAQTCEIRGND